MRVLKNEWDDTLEDLERNLAEAEQKKALKNIGFKMVFMIKQMMSAQLGFGNNLPYRKLKGKFRYRKPRGLVGGLTTIKSPITALTKALIDFGDLVRSWDVLKLNSKKVEIGPNTAHESMKAFYNDDRGDWEWSDKRSDEARDMWINNIEKGIW